jgi:hypothetical protein
VQEPKEKLVFAPDGSPEAAKEMVWLFVDTKLAVIELVTEDPASTDLCPEFAREKLNRDPVAGAVATGDELGARSPDSC